MLADVIDALRCPVCEADVELVGGAVRCAAGHSFDVARQGYANLLAGDAHCGTADTIAMVEARDAFLSAGHFAPIMDAVADAAEQMLASHTPGEIILDVGAGTGHYLARALDRLPGRRGVALDISKAAIRRAARAHDRMGAVVADTWRELPIRTGSAAAVLDVFAPRNASEFQRVLADGGVLIVVVPTTRHLSELVAALGLLTVDETKPERLAEAFAGRFAQVETTAVEWPMRLDRASVSALASMGPSAWHTDSAELADRIGRLPGFSTVTASVTVTAWRTLA